MSLRRTALVLLGAALAACGASPVRPGASLPEGGAGQPSATDAGLPPACDPGPRGTMDEPGPFDAVAVGSGLAAPDGAAVVVAEGQLGGTALRALIVTRVDAGAFAAHAPDVISARFDYPRIVIWLDLSGDGRCAADELWARQYYGIAWHEHVCIEEGRLDELGPSFAEGDAAAAVALCAEMEDIVAGR